MKYTVRLIIAALLVAPLAANAPGDLCHGCVPTNPVPLPPPGGGAPCYTVINVMATNLPGGCIWHPLQLQCVAIPCTLEWSYAVNSLGGCTGPVDFFWSGSNNGAYTGPGITNPGDVASGNGSFVIKCDSFQFVRIKALGAIWQNTYDCLHACNL